MPPTPCSTIVKDWEKPGECQAQYCYKNDHSWIENGLQYSCVDMAAPTEGGRVCTGVNTRAGCEEQERLDNMKICQLPSPSPKCVNEGGGSGSIPTTEMFGKRFIKFTNNCPSPIRMYATIDDAEYVKQGYDDLMMYHSSMELPQNYCDTPHSFKDSGPQFLKAGENCHFTTQFITPNIKPGDTYKYTEYLFDTGITTSALEKCPGHHAADKGWCRPGLNYSPIWSSVNKDNINDGEFTQYGRSQGRFEMTLGAGNIRDTTDISAMIQGGCTAKLLAFENDLGMADPGTNNCVEVPSPRPGYKVSQNLREAYIAMLTPQPSTSDYYMLYETIQYLRTHDNGQEIKDKPYGGWVGLQMDIPGWGNAVPTGDPSPGPNDAKGVGCFVQTDGDGVGAAPGISPKTTTKCRMPGGLVDGINTDFGINGAADNDTYVCTWPWKYNWAKDGNDYYLRPLREIDTDGEDKNNGYPLAPWDSPGSGTTICKNNYMYYKGGVATPSPCIKTEHAHEILTDMRSDLYACTLGQIKNDPHSIRHDLTNPPELTDFIGMQINIPSYSASKPILHNGPTQLKCIHNKDNNAESSYCPDAYQFAYDDLKATSESYLGGYTGDDSPEWNVTLCPGSTPPSPHHDKTCPMPSLPTSDNGEWYKDDDTWFYKCLKGYYPSTTPSPSASCDGGEILSYSQPIPTNGFCKEIECSPTPSHFTNGSWITGNDNDVFYASCTPGYIGATPPPTVTCHQGSYTNVLRIEEYCCKLATPPSIGVNGNWIPVTSPPLPPLPPLQPNKKLWKYKCNDNFNTSDTDHYAILDYSKWKDKECMMEYSTDPTGVEGTTPPPEPCTANVCSTPAPTYNGTWKKSGDIYTFNCDVDYHINQGLNQPTPTVRCVTSVPTISPTPAVPSTYCLYNSSNCGAKPTVSSEFHTTWNHYPHDFVDDYYSLECEGPYIKNTLAPSYSIECISGPNWSWKNDKGTVLAIPPPFSSTTPTPYCLYPCSTPSSTIGTFSESYNSFPTISWKLTCPSPTYKVSNPTYSCNQRSGYEGEKPVCSVIKCNPSPTPKPSNGTWVNVNNNDKLFEIKCDDNFAGSNPSPTAVCIAFTGKSNYTFSVPTKDINSYCCDLNKTPTPSEGGHWHPLRDQDNNNIIYNFYCDKGSSSGTHPSTKYMLDTCSFSTPSPSIVNFCSATCPSDPTNYNVPYTHWHTEQKQDDFCYATLTCDGSRGNNTSEFVLKENNEMDGWSNPVEKSIPSPFCEWSCSSGPAIKIPNGSWSSNDNKTWTGKCDKMYKFEDGAATPTATCNTASPSPDFFYTKIPQCIQDCPTDDKKLFYDWGPNPKCKTKNTPTKQTRSIRQGVPSECIKDKPMERKMYHLNHCRGGESDDGEIYGRKTLDSEDYYDSPERYSLMGQGYASIHAAYSTVKELNKLIKEFYTPNCGLYLDIPDEVLMKHHDLINTQVNPGYVHCFK
jgi:hypothetical protein